MGDQKYTRADVTGRNGQNGAPLWIIVKDVVYDVSSYLREHPGGEDALEEQAGKDATKDFEGVGHSSDARDIMKKYKIGEIVEKKKNEAAKGPVKSSNKLLPPKKPTSLGGPPPSKPKALPSAPQSGRASVLPPPDIAIRDLLEAPMSQSAMIPSELTLGANSTLLSSTFVPGTSSVCGSTVASVTSSGLVTVSSAQNKEAMSSSVINSVESQTIREEGSPNSKLTDSDSTAVASTITSTNMTQSSTSTLSLSSVPSSKSSPSILQGLSKVSLASSSPMPVTKQAQPWSSFSQPVKQKTPSTFSSSLSNTSSKTKVRQHDPFKNNKMAGGLKKK